MGPSRSSPPREPPAVDLVVIGLGYVGLPLAREASRAGLSVCGFDLDQDVVSELTAGRSHINDLADADVAELVERGFSATTDPAVLGRAAVAVVCVPTPVSPDGRPDLSAMIAAADSLVRHLRAGMLVVLESTTYPGTTDEVLRPLLEASGLVAGEDFYLAFSPERIDPGNPTFGLKNTPKIVGGHTRACTQRACAFYGWFVDTVIPARGTREAEMAKLLENTYRDVNIALVNEMAKFCQELSVDLWDVIRCASTKPFGFQAFYPGPGVGGHCIPIDPKYLSYRVRMLGYPFRLLEVAQEINAAMPDYVVRRAQDILNRDAKALHGARVLLLGVTYKPNVSDQRESPARHVARHLRRLGADVVYHDPYVREWHVDGEPVPRTDDLNAELASAELTIVLQGHSGYDLGEIARKARKLFDTRGQIADTQVERLLRPRGPAATRSGKEGITSRIPLVIPSGDHQQLISSGD
ncbi:MAG: nucleotide sugar dehydrogenase [Streptomycetales bacterium]